MFLFLFTILDKLVKKTIPFFLITFFIFIKFANIATAKIKKSTLVLKVISIVIKTYISIVCVVYIINVSIIIKYIVIKSIIS